MPELIIRRSQVRVLPAPPSLTCQDVSLRVCRSGAISCEGFLRSLTCLTMELPKSQTRAAMRCDSIARTVIETQVQSNVDLTPSRSTHGGWLNHAGSQRAWGGPRSCRTRARRREVAKPHRV